MEMSILQPKLTHHFCPNLNRLVELLSAWLNIWIILTYHHLTSGNQSWVGFHHGEITMKSREKRKRFHPVALALADRSGSRRPAADYFECPNPQSPAIFYTQTAVEAVAKMEFMDFNLTLETCSKVLVRLCLRMGFRQTLQDLGDFFSLLGG